MRKPYAYILGMTFLMCSCGDSKTSYVPSKVTTDSLSHVTDNSNDKSHSCFSINYKDNRNGVKTIHVKLNDAAGFDAIFDTGCSGMLISFQEAMSLVKAGTLTNDDSIGSQKSSIANGEIVENQVYKIHEVSVVDTNGVKHSVYDVPVSIVENPGADVLIGNIIIDRLAEYSYTVDLKNKVIVFQ